MSYSRAISPRVAAAILAGRADRLDYRLQGDQRLPDDYKVEVPLGDLRALRSSLADLPERDRLFPLLELLREQHGEALLEPGKGGDEYRLRESGTVSVRVSVAVGRRILLDTAPSTGRQPTPPSKIPEDAKMRLPYRLVAAPSHVPLWRADVQTPSQTHSLFIVSDRLPTLEEIQAVWEDYALVLSPGTIRPLGWSGPPTADAPLLLDIKTIRPRIAVMVIDRPEEV